MLKFHGFHGMRDYSFFEIDIQQDNFKVIQLLL
jgi:hypothetical protein